MRCRRWTREGREAAVFLDWLRALFSGHKNAPAGERPGMITRTCKHCGKTFTLPEEVQHWPDTCQACRAKYHPAETVTRVCRKCGRSFTFDASLRHWPKLCEECREG